MNGLTPEMREVVNMCKPVDLPEMISTAYQMEASSLYNVVKKEMQGQNKSSQRPLENVNKSYSTYNIHGGWKKNQQTTTTPHQGTKPNTSRPQLRLSDTQIAEKRRLGLLYMRREVV